MDFFVCFLGRGDKDWIQSLESIPLQAGCSYFGRSGPDPYQAWSKGHVPGSCLGHHSVSCFWHSWTGEYIPALICLDGCKNSLFICQIYPETLTSKRFDLCLRLADEPCVDLSSFCCWWISFASLSMPNWGVPEVTWMSCVTGRVSLCSGVFPSVRPGSSQCGQETHQHHSDYRGCSAPTQISDVGR